MKSNVGFVENHRVRDSALNATAEHFLVDVVEREHRDSTLNHFVLRGVNLKHERRIAFEQASDIARVRKNIVVIKCGFAELETDHSTGSPLDLSAPNRIITTLLPPTFPSADSLSGCVGLVSSIGLSGVALDKSWLLADVSSSLPDLDTIGSFGAGDRSTPTAKSGIVVAPNKMVFVGAPESEILTGSLFVNSGQKM